MPILNDSDLGILPWQTSSWAGLQRQLATLPHAILLHGTRGIGKVAFAEAFAQSLLCEQPESEGYACGQCMACGWFLQGNHPDYRRVRPENLETEMSDSPDGEPEGNKTAKSTKVPSKEIKIDQIRALSGFLNMSTHRRGRRIVVLYPVETMNHMAANALLKTLEEPPPSTLFLLVSHRPDRLLPTIVSRCRKIALPFPDRATALAWLRKQDIPQAEDRLAEEGGAPLAALAEARDDAVERFPAIATELAGADSTAILRVAERLQKQPPGRIVASMQRWLYDVLTFQVSGRIRYHPSYRAAIEQSAARVGTRQLLQLLRKLGERRAIADHPLSPKLFIEDMLLDYAALFQEVRHG